MKTWITISLFLLVYSAVVFAATASTQPTSIVLTPTATMVQTASSITEYKITVSGTGASWDVLVFHSTPNKIMFQLPGKSLTLLTPKSWSSAQFTIIGKAVDALNKMK